MGPGAVANCSPDVSRLSGGLRRSKGFVRTATGDVVRLVFLAGSHVVICDCKGAVSPAVAPSACTQLLASLGGVWVPALPVIASRAFRRSPCHQIHVVVARRRFCSALSRFAHHVANGLSTCAIGGNDAAIILCDG